ncbi:MAG TPA: GxxExxY protein [Kofleriaceae bacterium]|nr:GxxExxY protein [Kofleriaceae bacterium]
MNNQQDQLTTAIAESLRSPEPPDGAGLLHGGLSRRIIGAAIEVHKWLGPGQLESTYQHALERELAFRRIEHQAQVPIKAFYKGAQVGNFVVDLIVEDTIVVEIKVVARLLPVHRQQITSYLRTTGHGLGLLMNFHMPVLVQGVKRVLP